MGKKVICLFLAVCLTVILFPLNSVIAKAETAEVDSFEELKNALALSTATEIVVKNTIELCDGDVIEGNGKTVRAEITGVSESGIVQAGSGYTIFNIPSGGNVSISDMTIMGGSDRAIKSEGILTLDGVTVTRSGIGSVSGGGIYNSRGILILKNCNIIRNVASYGGGIYSGSGFVVMDGCSLSENRSINPTGGGGAAENNGGRMYINNSVISNNTSSEIGGGINNYESTLYIMDSTVTGNATTGGANSGGGIGLNSGTLYAANSIFTDNYYIPKDGDIIKSDIAKYGSGTLELNYCVYNTLQNISASGSNNIVATGTDVFAGYETSGILTGEGIMSEKTYSRPVLAKSPEGLFYVPLADGTPAASDGAPTFYDDSNIFNVKMAYGISALGDLSSPGVYNQVTRFIEDDENGTRISDYVVIGASGATDKIFYTLRLLPSDNGTASGGTVYGDSYLTGTKVTLKAVPAENYFFTGWLDENDNVLSASSTYVHTVGRSITITPSFGTTPLPVVYTPSEPTISSSVDPLPVEWAGEENPNTGFEFSFFSWIINLFA